MSEDKLYRHKGNGNIYAIPTMLNFSEVTVKQSSANAWERAVLYYDVETMKAYVTSNERFNLRFEGIKEQGE